MPSSFQIDLLAGDAWLGIVPFDMTGGRPRGVPPLPWVSAFPELNVRTYVRVNEKPGVYFSSAWTPGIRWRCWRRGCWDSRITARPCAFVRGTRVRYQSRRRSRRVTTEFEADYEPTGPVFNAAPGTLEYFLTERYGVYARDLLGRPYRLDIHHPPWELQTASAEFRCNSMAQAAGLHTPHGPPLLHYVRR